MRPVLALIGVTAIVAALQAATGSTLALGEILSGDPRATAILVELRLPRVAVGVAAGACLGVAGVILQAVLRNPLASPEVTGVGSGAVLGAVVATTAAASPAGLVLTAVIGGTVGGGVLWLVAARAGGDPRGLTVAGVLVSAVLAGAALIILTARPQLAGAMTRWLVGSLGGRTWEHWAALWPFALVCVVAGTLLGPVLAVLAVDDDHARAVGLDPGRWRPVVLIVAVVATAAAVAAVGALAFVGLLAPHLARALGGPPVPVAALAGAATVALADAVAQTVSGWAPAVGGTPPSLPAGVLTAVAGAIVMIRTAQGGSR
ncbi:FecCD family ABC transporter permease [Actinokineospora fastidiosa]|uniref:Ferrichrome ABC transporter permease n=1 Tax=Actinokineospora fastidiosa TaxID=1816 RepID=A0A918GCX6_9PSEU|nr:iron chelate uptake ABC transporter family permease subunit [Actinokineospora fastidiosa]GGS30585.1 ferrichrome ABC transporter permease [Actinokineospora fastidiosa]